MNKTKIILTDIEGTTSSLSFVKDVLFPYASQHLESFIEKNKNDKEIQGILLTVLNYNETVDRSPFTVHPFDISPLTAHQEKEAINILQTWIKLDLKIKPLKDLQGLIWEEGYKNKDFYGHIYDDAYGKLKEWHTQGIKIYIYSSGSIYAQKLLFGHTKFGDLNYLFSGNFDTNIGGKRETRSYLNIIEAINKDAPEITSDNILFLSDIEEELQAATDTGISIIKINREENLTNKNTPNQLIELGDFTEIQLN